MASLLNTNTMATSLSFKNNGRILISDEYQRKIQTGEETGVVEIKLQHWKDKKKVKREAW